MKKLYLFFIAVAAILSTTKAQNCPGPNPAFATPYITTSGCFVIVQNMIPNATLRVLNAQGQDITVGSASTTGTGSGSVSYNCNSSPAQVFSFVIVNGVAQTCFATVAPAVVLPVKLTGYSAHIQPSKKVRLNWTTSFEANSYAYIIEKSTDGRTFTEIGKMPASENSITTVRYAFDDKETLDGAAWYRLVMVDIDGSRSVSKTVYVNNKRFANASFSVFPNPFRSDLQITGVSATDVNRRSVRLYNAAGKEINYTISGSNAITIDANAPRGIYILRVDNRTFKLIKE
jgi:hypothetical protein